MVCNFFNNHYGWGSSKLVFASATGRIRSNNEIQIEDNDHEAADTLMINDTGIKDKRALCRICVFLSIH